MPLTKIQSLGITDGTIVNADINASAAIASTKLSGSLGKVLQVLQATDGTQRTTTSTSFVTGSNTLSISITPSSASNKVFILANVNYVYGTGRVEFTVYRGATNLAPVTYFVADHAAVEMPVSLVYLDSPSTTSATTYQIYWRVSSGTGYMNTVNALSTIHCLEIAG